MKKRYYLKNKKRFATFLFSIFLLFLTAGSITMAGAGSLQTETQIVTVKPGDTLWEIAEEYVDHPVDIREYIYQIRRLNCLESATIFAGQKLCLP